MGRDQNLQQLQKRPHYSSANVVKAEVGRLLSQTWQTRQPQKYRLITGTVDMFDSAEGRSRGYGYPRGFKRAIICQSLPVIVFPNSHWAQICRRLCNNIDNHWSLYIVSFSSTTLTIFCVGNMDQTTSTYSCSKIYNRCLHLLKATVSACSTIDQNPKDIFNLEQSWGRLVLWDEVFKDQSLDETLNRSPILRDTALRLFYEIGVTVLNDIIPLVLSRRPEAQRDVLEDLADEINTELQEATIVARECYEMVLGDTEKENKNWGELETNGNPPPTLSIAAETISFYVSHLLSLQPTIESLLRFYLCNRALHDDAHNSTELTLSSVPLHGEITHERDDNDYGIMDSLKDDSAPTNTSSTQYSQPEHPVKTRAKASGTVPSPGLSHPHRPLLAIHGSQPQSLQCFSCPNSPMVVVPEFVLSNTQVQMPQRSFSFCGSLEGMECSSPLVMVHSSP
ncbi:hypothetical protein NA56DRAFT_752671 [Hyaloscypha hepaticicola]|uniref:Uncharacterized protein n=1 Tax=Hyaloscypha hepaticicola TaxID=2082293 RepID=A0A2J6PSP7_9HELO|nr:hypothetical protein NA56DRAFT_752671 [Hyaloscypha hepaticicola]